MEPAIAIAGRGGNGLIYKKPLHSDPGIELLRYQINWFVTFISRDNAAHKHNANNVNKKQLEPNGCGTTNDQVRSKNEHAKAERETSADRIKHA